jgi:hypothetical protein
MQMNVLGLIVQGRLLIGKTAVDNTTVGFRFDGATGFASFCRSAGDVLLVNRKSTDGTVITIRNDGTEVGTIGVSGSTTSYNTSSDARLKDITGSARGLAVINELNPVAYDWKADGKSDEGLIAQEVEEIVPNAVSETEDNYYQMDYSKLVVHLVKGMQEQQKQIESLKSEIQLLKGGN